MSPKRFSPVLFMFVILLCVMLSGAVAQDNINIENKTVLELSPIILSKGLPENWHLHTDKGNEDITVSSRLSGLTEDKAALFLTPDTESITLVSPIVPIATSCSAVTGVVLGTGSNNADVSMQWLSGDEVLTTTPLREPPMSNETNRRFNLSESVRPENANGLQLLLTVNPTENNGTFHCTTVRLTGTFQEQRRIELFCNKIGYDQVGSKSFTAYANFLAQSAVFTLNDVVGEVVYTGELSSATRIQGADGIEWDGYYYKGEFTSFEKEGEFSITITLDDQPPISVPIRIGFTLLWNEAFAPAIAPFTRFRVEGTESLNLWEAAYVGDSTEPALLWDLVRSWSILQGRFRNDRAFQPLNDEVLYGLEKVAQWVITHGNTDENDFVGQTFHAASLACGAHFHKENASILEAAKILAETTMSNNLEGVLPFSIAMDMLEATKEQQYLEYAERIYPGVSINRIEPLLSYEGYMRENVSIRLNNIFSGIAEKIIKSANNPFGLPKGITEGQRGFFLWEADSTTPLKGSNARILAVAEIMAQAYRYASSTANRDFVYDQLNWVLGNNPYNVCLIAGLCNPEQPPLFLPEGMTITDAKGFVLHGIGPRSTNEDYPYFAVAADEINESTNGFSLYDNARYISAMAYLNRIPVARPL